MKIDVSTDHIVVSEEIANLYGLKKGLELIRKACTAPLAKEAVDEEERSIISVISTGDVDRDGDVLRPDGMDDSSFRKHPIVLFGHQYRELPIGRNEWIRVLGKKVIAKTIYAPGDINPLAEKIFRFRQRGFPLAQSIGFIASEIVWADSDGFQTEVEDVVSRGWVQKNQKKLIRRIIKKWVLYEYSDVVVPANPEALALAVTKGLITLGADRAPKSEKDESTLIIKHLCERLEEIEARIKTLEKKQEVQKKFKNEVITLENLEKILPAVTRIFQKEIRATSREFAQTLARFTGKVTIPQ